MFLAQTVESFLVYLSLGDRFLNHDPLWVPKVFDNLSVYPKNVGCTFVEAFP